MNRPQAATEAAHAGSPQPRRRTTVLIVMCVGLFFVQLDVTVVNVALPSIGAQFHATTSDLQWVVGAYSLVLASLLLVGGSIGDRYGHRRVVLAGLGVFALASAACALASDVVTVTLARAGQGLGAALLLPGTLAVI